MGKAMKVSLLQPEDVERFWPQIAESMRSVEHLWSDKWTLDHFHYAAMNQHVQLWGIGYEDIEYVVVTEVRVYPANRFLEIVFMFGEGDLDACVEALVERLHLYAFIQNCKCIEIPCAREGWARELAPHMKKIGVVLMTHTARVVN